MNRTALSILFSICSIAWACDDAETRRFEGCGDGRLDPGEECDGGSVEAPFCSALGYYGEDARVSCRIDCRWDVSVCSAERCGDGILQSRYRESCDGDDLGGASCASLGYDDGALGCTEACGFDLSGCVGAETCGDGQIQAPEECDGSDLGGESCASIGQYGGALGCTTDCRFEMSDCEGRCGDGVLNAAHGEECDLAAFGNASCQSLGFYSGQLACTQACLIDAGACTGACGDGVIDPAFGEQCEPGDTGEATCQTLGYYAGTLACGSHCRYDRSGCQSRCGDGILQAENGEECDGSELGGATCQDFSYYTGTLTCSSNCRHVRTGCALYCGDGIRQAAYGESCDRNDLGSTNCYNLGYWDGGLPTCDSSCSFTGCVSLVANAAGGSSCAVDDTGAAWCWGGNESGQLGDGTAMQRNWRTEVLMPPGRRFGAITVGRRHACALDDLGAAWCWGANGSDQLGTTVVAAEYLSPVQVSMPVGRTFTAIHAGYEHTCALDDLGAAWCWGANQHGQAGIGTADLVVETPTRVAMPVGSVFTRLSTLHHTNCALDSLGAIWCWGNNYNGQCGDGGTSSLNAPGAVVLPPGTTMTDLASGGWHSCAVDALGAAWCWGAAYDGQLGDNTIIEHHLPALVQMPAGVTFSSITAATSTTCALDVTGRAWCWGSDSFGTMGNGSSAGTRIPAVATMPAGVLFEAIDAGVNHVCALDRPGELWCWGYNNEHQVGDSDGSTANRTTPSQVFPY